MKTLLALFCLALGGCAIPAVSLQDSEVARYAVVAVDLQAWLGDNSRGEFAFVSHIDGTWEDNYPLKKAGRIGADGPIVKYLLIEPGARDLTLVYNRHSLSPSGRQLWSGGITERAVVKPGRYFVKYQVEGNFVTLWLEDSAGTAVTEKRRSVIAEVVSTSPTVIPIIIPK
jgi:hypothetical protein